MKKCSTDVLKVRNTISDNIRDVVNIVTTQPDIIPVGTFKYEIFKYPGDIDIFEDIETCCDYSVAKLKVAMKIQEIIQKIKNSNVLFSDFKAGYDLRYKLYVGNIGTEITDYNYRIVHRDVNALFHANLLTIDEYNKMIKLVKPHPTFDDIVELNELLREHWVLRWSEAELLQGYKTLRGNVRMYLDTAIGQGSIVKIDTISYVDGRFIEITNFFLITVLDKYGKKTVITEELKDYEESLLMDVYKYYETNTLKSVKRLWMYLAFKQQICDLNLFTDLFKSNISLVSQVIADVETAILLSDKTLNKEMLKKYDKNLLKQSLDTRLSIVKNICDVSKYDKVSLEKLQKCLRNYVNNETKKWLASKSIDLFSLIK